MESKVKYVLIYDYIDVRGFVHRENKLVMTNRDVANKKWLEMKKDRNVTNMRPETIKEPEEEHIVTVAFKTYDYVVKGPVKKGQKITVMSGGQPIELEVLKVDPPKKTGINYVYAENVVA